MPSACRPAETPPARLPKCLRRIRLEYRHALPTIPSTFIRRTTGRTSRTGTGEWQRLEYRERRCKVLSGYAAPSVSSESMPTFSEFGRRQTFSRQNLGGKGLSCLGLRHSPCQRLETSTPPTVARTLFRRATRTLPSIWFCHHQHSDPHPTHIELDCERPSRLGAVLRFRMGSAADDRFDFRYAQRRCDARLTLRLVVPAIFVSDEKGRRSRSVAYLTRQTCFVGLLPSWRALLRASLPLRS